MSNRLWLATTTFNNPATGDVSHGYRMYDDYANMYSNYWEAAVIDDMELLKAVVLEESSEEDDAIESHIFDQEKSQTGMYINDSWYEAEQLAPLIEKWREESEELAENTAPPVEQPSDTPRIATETASDATAEPARLSRLEVSERIQNDLICLLDSHFGQVEYVDEVKTAACQIVVDAFKLSAVKLEPQTVWFAWGSDYEDGDHPYTYEFETPTEMNAFLHGVNEAIGASDCEQFDTEQEAIDYIKEKTTNT